MGLLAVALMLPLTAQADDLLSGDSWMFQPYVGVDLFDRFMDFNDDDSVDMFRDHYPSGKLFAGVKLHRYFGIEGGYQTSIERTQRRFFTSSQSPVLFGGSPLDLPGFQGDDLLVDTWTQIDGWNIDLVGFIPICEDVTEVFIKLGYSSLTLDQKVTFWADPASHLIEHLQWSEEEGMFSATIGILHAFTHNFGGRIFVTWDGTSELDSQNYSVVLNTLDPNGRGGAITVDPEDSWSFGVGLFYAWR